MAFLDEEEAIRAPEPPEPPRRRAPRGGGRTPRQQLLLRRLVAVGIGLAILLLIVLGFRGCLEAREKRAIENYVNDVGAVMADSAKIGQDFFGVMRSPGTRSTVEFQAEINSDRGAADQLTGRADALNPPGDLAAAHQAIELTLELRRRGLEVVANNMATALGRENRTEAVQRITDQMPLFLASDVLYAQVAQPVIAEVLAEKGIGGQAPGGAFLPDAVTQLPSWADVNEMLSRVAGTAPVATGTHGVGIVSVSLGDTTLIAGTPVTVSTADTRLQVEVQNQGDTDETDIVVNTSIGGETREATIPSIAAGETETATIDISPLPASGSQVTIDVIVQPVPGELDEENNTATYDVTFE